MLNQDFLATHGILGIGIVYFSFNLLHKNVMNLVVFLTVLVFSYPFFTNKMNGLVFTLVASLCLGIIRNFHLLENFENNKKVVRLSNILLDKLPSYKIKKVTIDLNDMKPILKITDDEIISLKQELESGYSTLNEYPFFVSNDNFIVQGNVLHSVLKKYPELNNENKVVYKINENKDTIIRRLPMLKLMSGISDDEFKALDISKLS